MKVDWLSLCVEMMLEYIPQEINTQSANDKYLNIGDHFISVIRFYNARTIVKENYIEKIKAAMIHAARQNFDFLKRWAINEELL